MKFKIEAHDIIYYTFIIEANTAKEAVDKLYSLDWDTEYETREPSGDLHEVDIISDENGHIVDYEDEESDATLEKELERDFGGKE